MAKEFVRCCDISKTENLIFIRDGSNNFFIEGCRVPVYYCPWCKTLLDLNLLGDD